MLHILVSSMVAAASYPRVDLDKAVILNGLINECFSSEDTDFFCSFTDGEIICRTFPSKEGKGGVNINLLVKVFDCIEDAPPKNKKITSEKRQNSEVGSILSYIHYFTIQNRSAHVNCDVTTYEFKEMSGNMDNFEFFVKCR